MVDQTAITSATPVIVPLRTIDCCGLYFIWILPNETKGMLLSVIVTFTEADDVDEVFGSKTATVIVYELFDDKLRAGTVNTDEFPVRKPSHEPPNIGDNSTQDQK